MTDFNKLSENKLSFKEDIQNIFKILPKIEKKVLDEVDKMDYIQNKILKIDVEDKKKFEITIKIIE